VLAAPTATPAAIQVLNSLLRGPAYRVHGQTGTALTQILDALTHPQGMPVLTTAYAQTLPSLTAAAASASALRNQVNMVQVTVPSAATAVAGILLLAGFVLAWRRRHRPDVALSPDPSNVIPRSFDRAADLAPPAPDAPVPSTGPGGVENA
jgi:hypothetical protein